MNDTSTNPSQPQPYDRHEARQQRREERRADYAPSGVGALVAGLLLILLGVAFLMQNFGDFIIPIHNWWALFIMIPAVAALDRAYRIYRAEGNLLTPAARGSLFGGLVLSLITATFLFSLSWSLVGPSLIIIAGVSILLNGTK